MEFDCNFQKLKNFEQEAPDHTWMIDQLINGNLEFQIHQFFLDLLPEFAVNSFEF
jgi:hypothetical protein